MITNQNFSILIWTKKGRIKNDKVPLSLRITVNGQRAEISTNQYVELSHWASKAQKVIGRSPEAKDINKHLEAMKSVLHSHQSRLITLGKIVTAHMLKNEYLGITDDRKSLCDAFNFLIERKKQLQKKKKLSKTTVDKYKNTFEYVKSFIKKNEKVNDIQLSDIKPSFIEDFAHYLLTESDLGNNTAMKKVDQAKSAFILAHKRRWISRNLADFYQCSFNEKEPTRLEIDELYTLCSKEINILRIAQARDCYAFMCFTGYAYIDAKKLTSENLFRGPDMKLWIKKNREKTDTSECVPLLPIPIDILNKYTARGL